MVIAGVNLEGDVGACLDCDASVVEQNGELVA